MIGYDFYPTRVFLSPRLGDRKQNSLDKNYIKSQTMGDPIVIDSFKHTFNSY
jgi:hypothetical protein